MEESKIIKDYKEESKKPKLNRRQRRQLARMILKGKGLKQKITKKIKLPDADTI